MPLGEAEQFQAMTAALAGETHRRFRLAELADFLHTLPADAFRRAVHEAPRAALDAATLNHLAGAVELAAARRDLESPPWTGQVPPAELPSFGSSLASVRLHLLTRAPVALRRRNVFVDASVDERV